MTSKYCDYPGARFMPSPNFGDRAGQRAPDMIVLHYTGMPTGASALEWLCREESQVSSHYFVHEDGRVDQLVPEARRAWHAGKSYWKGETDINLTGKAPGLKLRLVGKNKSGTLRITGLIILDGKVTSVVVGDAGNIKVKGVITSRSNKGPFTVTGRCA